MDLLTKKNENESKIIKQGRIIRCHRLETKQHMPRPPSTEFLPFVPTNLDHLSQADRNYNIVVLQLVESHQSQPNLAATEKKRQREALARRFQTWRNRAEKRIMNHSNPKKRSRTDTVSFNVVYMLCSMLVVNTRKRSNSVGTSILDGDVTMAHGGFRHWCLCIHN